MNFSGNLILLDPVSIGGSGHCETFGMAMVEFALDQGIPLKIMCSEHFPQDKIDAFNAIPFFPHSVHLFAHVHTKKGEADLSVGFEQFVSAMHRFTPFVTPNDVLWDYFVHSAPQLISYVRWLKETPEPIRPRLVANLDWFQDFFPDWLEPVYQDIRDLQPWLRLASASPTNPNKMEKLIGVPVLHTPRPLAPTRTPQPQTGRTRVGYLGQPSKLKSFHLYAEMVERCITETEIDFIFNFRDINYEPECLIARERIIELAQLHPDRVTYYQGMMEYDKFKSVMSSLSGVLVAYDPKSHFRDTPSGTVVESLLVDTLPIAIEGTSMVSEMRLFNLLAPVIAEQSVNALVDALKDLEKNYTMYIEKNRRPLEAWHAFQSYEVLFEKILNQAWDAYEVESA